MLYQMMISDDDIDPRELATLYELGEKRGVSQSDMMNIMMNPVSFSVPESIEGKVALLYDIAVMAWADGEIEEREETLIKNVCKKLGFLPENADNITKFLLEEVNNGVTEEELLNKLKE